MASEHTADPRYAAYPDHPLARVPRAVLDVAREVLAGAVEEHDVDPEMAEPIADAVVAALAEAGYLRTDSHGDNNE